MTDWQINIHPVPNPEPDPAGYLVARFTAETTDCTATGDIIRGPKGLAVARVEYTTRSPSGIATRMVRELRFDEVLARARTCPGVAATAPATPPKEQCCPCEYHGTRRGGRPLLTDAHLRGVAVAYLEAVAPGQPKPVSQYPMERYGRPEGTVRSWVKLARRDGWLGPGVKGRAGAEPGPRLIAERTATPASA